MLYYLVTRFDGAPSMQLHHSSPNLFDKKLQELLTRIVNGRISETDRLYNRPNYLSRVHESVRTREEFEEFKRSIYSNEASGYLKDKKDMNFVVTSHLKDRF